MTLHYTFENMECDVLNSALSHINGGDFQPHYHKEKQDIEFDYDIKVSFQDFLEFVKPSDFHKWGEEGQMAYEIACRDIWYSEWFNTDELEEDEDFIEFMTARYEKKAYKECAEECQY